MAGTAGETGRRLLIVEAENRPRDQYQRVLEQAGYALVAAPYQDAVAVSRTANPAVVILQLVDPADEGLRLVREFRTHAETRGTPIIALMRFDDAHTREQVVRAGATAILIDPVKPPMLLRQLRRILARTPVSAHVPKVVMTPAPSEVSRA